MHETHAMMMMMMMMMMKDETCGRTVERKSRLSTFYWFGTRVCDGWGRDGLFTIFVL